MSRLSLAPRAFAPMRSRQARSRPALPAASTASTSCSNGPRRRSRSTSS
jgi:hypothetical protein